MVDTDTCIFFSVEFPMSAHWVEHIQKIGWQNPACIEKIHAPETCKVNDFLGRYGYTMEKKDVWMQFGVVYMVWKGDSRCLYKATMAVRKLINDGDLRHDTRISFWNV